MMEKIRVLQVEDNSDDALLILRALKKAGFDLIAKRVETAEELSCALKEESWDIVLSDYSMPKFDGLTALEQVSKHDPDLPFILVSGAVGEETAVEFMKAGARDFIMKDKLGRLGPAIKREVAEARLHKDKRRVEEQKIKLEEQLWQAQKMEAIGTLAGGIAHDFNNILTAIIGYSELAERDLLDRPDTRRKVFEVIKAGNRAKDLVQHILTFSRKKTEERSSLEAHLVINEALKLLRASTPSTIEYQLDISKDCGTIKANPSQLHQIVMNLCTNAYHAMSEKGGVMTVSLKKVKLAYGEISGEDNPPGEYVRLVVADNGTGIEANLLDKIFNPYFTTKSQGVGTGLGLSLVLGIVKSHDAYINVESEVGKGTIFSLYFPVSHGSEKSSKDELNTGSMPTGGEQVLVVDDEQIIVQFTQEILTALGYKVTTAVSGPEALAVFQERPDDFSLVITDMTMPKMLGTELAVRLLEIRADLPIILCTGHSDKVNREIAENIGIKEYRVKPVSAPELAVLVRSVIDGGQNK